MSDDPSESQVRENTADIVVHDITLPVDIETGDSQLALPPPVKEPAKEPVYDNVNPIGNDKQNNVSSEKVEKMKTLLTLASPQPDTKPPVAPEPAPEPKSPRKHIADVSQEDLNDTDSLAGFLNDVKQIAKEKGVSVEPSQGMLTLFEDANEVD